jgi:hypothetical protein
VYGAPLPAFTTSYSGFVNGDTPAILGGVLSFTTLATAASRVGSYAITPSGQTSTNYSIAYANGVLSVIKAPLTITAKNAAKTFNTPNPALTWTASGFVNGDGTSVPMPSPPCTTTATTTSPVDTYPITCSGANATNYAISYVSGTLTATCHYVSITLSPSSVALGGLIYCYWNAEVLRKQDTNRGRSVHFERASTAQQLQRHEIEYVYDSTLSVTAEYVADRVVSFQGSEANLSGNLFHHSHDTGERESCGHFFGHTYGYGALGWASPGIATETSWMNASRI